MNTNRPAYLELEQLVLQQAERIKQLLERIELLEEERLFNTNNMVG